MENNVASGYMTKGKNNIPFVRVTGFDSLSFVNYGYSTRLGGVSESYFREMNLGLKLGDDREKVIQNYKLISEAIGLSDYRRIVCPDQVHLTNIRHVTEELAGDGIEKPLSAKEIDGQITNVPGIPLIVYGADCVPLLFADPKKKVVGTAHGGWKGTAAGIAGKMIREMKEVYGCDPQDIFVAIGPSAGACCYEVDDVVLNEMKKVMPESEYLVMKGEKTHCDLWRANRFFLIEEGVREDRIFISGECTICKADVYHSHRASGGKRGLNAGFIEIKQ